jgi:formate dehydrogenase beta subunit
MKKRIEMQADGSGGKRRRGPRARKKGASVDPKALTEVRALLGEASRAPDLLIEHLHRIQDHFGHIPAVHLVALASEMRLAVTEVYEVASFYHHFDVVRVGQEPPPDLTVRVCESVTCEMLGAHALMDALKDALGDAVRIQAVPCVGRCATAPVAVVGRNPIGRADVSGVTAAVNQDATEAALPDAIDHAAYRADGGYETLRRCRAGDFRPEDVITRLEDAGLRGLGGAGFPAGRKWRIVRDQPAPRLMAVNIDEGEPGTFKDRYFLERDPHRFMEGAC